MGEDRDKEKGDKGEIFHYSSYRPRQDGSWAPNMLSIIGFMEIFLISSPFYRILSLVGLDEVEKEKFEINISWIT